jgi:glutamate-1-semialdehyde aminotransferase
MPVAAVAGRRDVMELCTRRSGRVKFEGGTYSAQELSLLAARTMLRHLIDDEQEIYDRLARLGKSLREGVERASRETGVPLFILGRPDGVLPGSSTVYVHSALEGAETPASPEALAERGNPLISERLFKSTLILEGVSGRTGLGGISMAHDDEHLQRTADALVRTLHRFKKAGLA